MPKLLKRILKALGLTIVATLTAGLVFVYTRPVRISPNKPARDNAKRVQRLLTVKKALFIGAHPDDIEFYAGGLVYMLRHRGAEVTFAIATRGGKGRTGAAKALLEARRSRDQLESARILGGVHVILYHYPDKGLPHHVNEFADDLVKLIRKEKPDMVFTWDPEFTYNRHPDHVAAAKSARKALDITGAKWCGYGTFEPNVWVGYGDDIFRIKIKSLRAHTTETPWYYWPWVKRWLTRKTSGEGAKIHAKYAEFFRCEQ